MTILDNYGTTFSHAGIGGEYLGTARDHELASASVTPALELTIEVVGPFKTPEEQPS
jgi:hypothetical protein